MSLRQIKRKNIHKYSTRAEAILRKFNKLLGNFWLDDDSSNVRRCFTVALIGIVENTRIKELMRHHAALTTSTVSK